MDINKLYEALSEEERDYLAFLMNNDKIKSSNCTIKNWADYYLKKSKITLQLYNILVEGINTYWGTNMLISELTFENFIKVKGAGEKKWLNIIQLRGY